MSLSWKPEMAVGIRAIDLQHQELIEIINGLEATLKLGDDALLEPLLQRLLSYVVFHFEVEESMMRAKSAYAKHAELHIREHSHFVNQLRSLHATDRAERRRGVEGMLDYLKYWVVNHIQKTDRDLATLLLAGDPARSH
ncbi:bacteriohemerythrin [Denitratisoma sp. DHT3]|uniref:bacteriohemerythrin n=1 Tax=Denitratisoma sp. DHT3 TaxID=1981880 RepID=UPI001648CC23|nr:bacteriohemerythrin [Denitratisoma sp. DHT3]